MIEGLPPRLAGAVARATGGGEAWLVGGYVRDRLLGRPPVDADVAVAGDPRAVARRIANEVGGHAFPLSEEHGAWRITPAEGEKGSQLDITHLRGSLNRDLGLRDFTINTIALPVDGGMPVDPLGGIADLREGVVRAASQSAIRNDPIRALRAVRHAAELEMRIEEETASLIHREASLLVTVSGERQRDELIRILDTGGGAAALRLMDDLRLFGVVLPEMEPARGCQQPPEHFWDVLEHSIETVAVLDCLLLRQSEGRTDRSGANAPGSAGVSPASYVFAAATAGETRGLPGGAIRASWRRHAAALCDQRRRESGPWWSDAAAPYWDDPITPPRSRRAVLKLVGLLHDVGKPACRSVDEEGRIRFFGHDERGGEIVEEIFQRLRFSSAETRYAALLVREHLRPGQLAPLGQVPSARALFRLSRELGENLPDLLVLNLADGAAAAGPRQRPEEWASHVAYARGILAQRDEQRERAGPKRLVTGHDLMAELGIGPGPALGRLLEALAEAQAAGEIDSPEQALALARSLRERDPDRRSELG